jgi:GGDEF domain-containing protein
MQGLEMVATELTALNAAIAPPAPAAMPAAPEQFGMRRRDLENMIRMKVESTETFCLMIVWLRNLPMLFNKHQPDVVLETMNAAARRLGKTLVGNPLWSKWEDDSFVVFVGQPKANAQKASKEIADKLNAVYSIESPNGTVEVSLRVAAGVVDRTKDENADHLLGRAQQLIKNLRAMP